MIEVKRAYDPPAGSDGKRFLVDRLWPRGLKKETLQLTDWLKDAAPSNALRQWFNHDPAKWDEFQKRYRKELEGHPQAWAALLENARAGKITLVYAARDGLHNNAIVLKDYLNEQIHAKR